MVDPSSFDILTMILIAMLGLIAGLLGGMLGVGGSVIMIPGLVMMFGIADEHLFQASAMIANVAVAAPAAWKHYQAGSTKKAVLLWMLPFAVGFVMVGVWISNMPLFAGPEGAIWLGRMLSLFLLYVVYANFVKLFGADKQDGAEAPTWNAPSHLKAKASSIGGGMGTLAGLLGIGGGALAVPLQQVLLKLPLRNCVANSSVVMVLSASFGAVMKSATLPMHSGHYEATDAILLAAFLIPTAIVGSRVGASLTYILPIRTIRIIFIVLMIVSAWKMASLGSLINAA